MNDDERREAERLAFKYCDEQSDPAGIGICIADFSEGYAAGRESMRAELDLFNKLDAANEVSKKALAERARSERYAQLLRDVLDLPQIADGHPRGIKALIREALKNV